jgi:hypothetical protein
MMQEAGTERAEQKIAKDAKGEKRKRWMQRGWEIGSNGRMGFILRFFWGA